MSREDTGMSFQEVYDAFQHDFHRTPQKIVTVRNRNTHLKSTVESNNNSNIFSNYKSMDEEYEFSCECNTNQTNQLCLHKLPNNNRQNNHNTLLSHAYNSKFESKNKLSPYDIEFDVLGNSLYESLQDCFTKSVTQQNHLFSGLASTSSSVQQFNYASCTQTIKSKFETSLDNIYITEDNFESMEDEDKENRDPLLYGKQFETIGICSSITSPRQLSLEGEDIYDSNSNQQTGKQSSYPFHNESIILADNIGIDETIFEQNEDQIIKRQRNICDQNIFSDGKHYLQCNEKNLLTPTYDNQISEIHNKLSSRRHLEQIGESAKYHSTQKKLNTLQPNNSQRDQSDEVQVVRFKQDLETVISYNESNNYERNLFENSNETIINSENRYKKQSTQNSYTTTTNVNNISISNFNNYSNNTSLYQQHNHQSASQINRMIKQQQSSINRTPLRDITSSTIFSAKKKYQGVKKMLEFSSPIMNTLDSITCSKQKNNSVKSQRQPQSSLNKAVCPPAIFYR